MLDKQRLEALRQLEVSKAIEKLLDEDKQRRQSMKDRFTRRMTEAEIRKRRREQDYWRVFKFKAIAFDIFFHKPKIGFKFYIFLTHVYCSMYLK